MFAATDTPWAPWDVVGPDHKERGGLHLIGHRLSLVPYTPLDAPDSTLPERTVAASGDRPGLPMKHIPTPF